MSGDQGKLAATGQYVWLRGPTGTTVFSTEPGGGPPAAEQASRPMTASRCVRTTSDSIGSTPPAIGSELEIRSRLSPEELAAALGTSLVEPYKQQLMGRWTRLSGRVDGVGTFTVRIVKPVFGLGAHCPFSFFECAGVIEPTGAGGARLVGSVRPRTDKGWADTSKMVNAASGWNFVVAGLVGGFVGWGIGGFGGAVTGVGALVALNLLMLRWATALTGKAERKAILGALETVVADAEEASPGRQEATG